MYVNRGFYITPTVIHLPADGCQDEYVRQMRKLIKNLGGSTPFIPDTKHVPNTRPKRFAVTAIVAGLAALLSTVSMGNGISNSVDVSKLKETVQFLEKNQARISVDLAESTKELMRMKTEHSNVYYALTQKVNITKINSDINACSIGLVRLDNIADSILSQALTNHILPSHQIMNFLRGNQILRDSLYTLYPRLVYKLGRVELVNVDPGSRVFTVLVLLPHISAAPDGYFFSPLFAPRFFPNSNGSTVEHVPKIPPLFSLNSAMSHDNEMLTMDQEKCDFFNFGVICPLTAQSYTPATTCANRLLSNQTGPALAEACGIFTHPSARSSLTTMAESTTSVLIFSNEGVKGAGPAGVIDIIPEAAPPACVLINKVALHELRVGPNTVLLNLRSDAYSLSPQEKEITRHLHTLRNPLYDPQAAFQVAPFHPFSAHFASTVLGALGVSACLLAVIALISYLSRRLDRRRRRMSGDPKRRAQFLRGTHFRQHDESVLPHDPEVQDP